MKGGSLTAPESQGQYTWNHEFCIVGNCFVRKKDPVRNTDLKFFGLKFIHITGLFLLFFFTLLPCGFPEDQTSIDEPFISPSNWGGTGLMEVPTARVMREDSYRLGIGQVRPYRYYYGAVSPLRGLEIDGRVTEVLGVPSGLVDQKNIKDKAVDFKYQFVTEGKYMPALAVGIMDPNGTRIYPSQYITASKQIFPFDFTLGFGNGRFGKKPLLSRTEKLKVEMITDTGDWLRDSEFFWGVQFAPSEKYSLMLEFSPIRFDEQTTDPAQSKNFREPVPSKYNFGIRIKPTKWADITLSYQRGEEFGINFSTAFDIGKPLVPIYDPIYRETPADRLNPLQIRITESLYHSGFSSIGVAVVDDQLWIEAQNEKYFYTIRALGIILRILADITPENINRIHIILKENEIPVFEFVTSNTDIRDLYTDKMTLYEFLRLSEFNAVVPDLPDIRDEHKKSLRYGIRPSLETFLNDPSGFFRYRLGVSGWINYQPWKGGSFITGLATYPLNNITTTNEPLSIPVRSDIVPYKEKKLALSRLMFDQIQKLTPQLYGKISGGILEIQYAGLDAEIALPLFEGRILTGLSGSAVKKRDPDNTLQLKSDDVKDIYSTAFLNMRLNIPETDMAIDVKAGRFLAGDNGVRITVSKLINGVKIWAWFSVTDTSVFGDDFNRGYNDRGIGVSIPLRLFKGTDTRTSYDYVLSPWTRDTGQDIDHFSTLFDFIGRNNKIFLDKDREKLY